MTLSEYQEKAARTINPTLTDETMLRHALFGLTAEVGEITGLFQKQLQGHPLLLEHLEKEIGDVLWMAAELCTSFDLDMGEVAEANIEKLKKRYPEGFTSENSINRTE
jgi:NTP pyrophosphatase (non-canonical NTP hydrolase)